MSITGYYPCWPRKRHGIRNGCTGFWPSLPSHDLITKRGSMPPGSRPPGTDVLHTSHDASSAIATRAESAGRRPLRVEGARPGSPSVTGAASAFSGIGEIVAGRVRRSRSRPGQHQPGISKGNTRPTQHVPRGRPTREQHGQNGIPRHTAARLSFKGRALPARTGLLLTGRL